MGWATAVDRDGNRILDLEVGSFATGTDIPPEEARRFGAGGVPNQLGDLNFDNKVIASIGDGIQVTYFAIQTPA
jgi:hypothetical protein